MALGKQVRLYRERLSLTLEQLEEMSGVAIGTISALEVRDSVRSKYAPALANAFGLTLEQLYDESRNWLTEEELQKADRKTADKPASSEWPFKQITIDRYNLLSDKQKEAIEEWVDQQITSYTSHTSANKSPRNKHKLTA
ncbi:MAG: hypothetical protein CML16_03150 [Pusillimonas sp.]|nr:hypothetical protein [Pusillimonas sp.]MBC43584.1 hypothetical protein [Pusillimonas sp.]HCP78967.1 hypothetical protein [Pusillimonas sp.]|tara:strand:- start:1094 stop:1513 length:420 start_codon:yes stop_codon:yes gene_type:complete